ARPFSACFRIAMIWLSENLDCFIAELSSSLVENSTSDPDYLQGVLPTQRKSASVKIEGRP
ncbi:hypothetical protein, partial [Limnobacter sp.]|uniref:hypothetical protein n=1 Tax=Limnobacter sp. TaxID=2003368 RepID=UPI0039C93739